MDQETNSINKISCLPGLPLSNDRKSLRGMGRESIDVFVDDFVVNWECNGDGFDSEVGFKWDGPVLRPVIVSDTPININHPNKIQPGLSNQLCIRVEPWCKQRELGLLTKEEFSIKEKIPEPVVVYFLSTEDSSGLYESELENLELKLQELVIPPMTTSLFFEVYLARDGIFLCHGLYVYYFQ